MDDPREASSLEDQRHPSAAECVNVSSEGRCVGAAAALLPRPLAKWLVNALTPLATQTHASSASFVLFFSLPL